jgi:hypothetical protein
MKQLGRRRPNYFCEVRRSMVGVFLLIYFIIIVAVIEIFVVLFRLTGLKVEISRFQVISMMTGTGFTTEESELISSHPIRRRLATFLILFGAFSLAVIISSISQFLASGLRTKEIASSAAAVLLVFGILKLPGVQKRLANWFNREMKQTIELADLPIRDVFLKNSEVTMILMQIYHDSQLANRSIRQVYPDIEESELSILYVKRGSLMIRKNVTDTPIHEGDQLLLYGSKRLIFNTFAHDIGVMKNHNP